MSFWTADILRLRKSLDYWDDIKLARRLLGLPRRAAFVAAAAAPLCAAALILLTFTGWWVWLAAGAVTLVYWVCLVLDVRYWEKVVRTWLEEREAR